MAGKGDKPRPMDRKKFEENYDRIFKKSDCKKCCGGKCNEKKNTNTTH